MEPVLDDAAAQSLLGRRSPDTVVVTTRDLVQRAVIRAIGRIHGGGGGEGRAGADLVKARLRPPLSPAASWKTVGASPS
jgi:hypothetical protein